MKTVLTILKWTGIVIVALVALVVAAVYLNYPPKLNEPYPDIVAVTDSAVIAHGKYLVYGPAHCAICHGAASRDDLETLAQKIFTLPLSGGLEFNMPGAKIHAKNLTPDKETGIGRYTDAELARMIRYGVRHNNEVMFPFMSFGNLSDADLQAIISFLRSQPPVKKEIPPNELNFMMKGAMAFLVTPYGPKGEIAKTVVQDTTAQYGAYLANHVAGCHDCHTNADLMTGKFIGQPFAGGQKTPDIYEDPNTWVYTPNLTPDPKTGKIFHWDKDQFIARFKKTGRTVKNSIMPWECYTSLTDNDLTAIYHYLKSLPPVYNEVKEVVVHE